MTPYRSADPVGIVNGIRAFLLWGAREADRHRWFSGLGRMGSLTSSVLLKFRVDTSEARRALAELRANEAPEEHW